ncbi:MAG: hypothetical protein IPL74_13565 [Bacteroidetes bacterium]|nr:hypothetical protein [Bacteroidota bacterium]
MFITLIQAQPEVCRGVESEKFPFWGNLQDHYVAVTASNLNDNSTLAHELGHYLGLYHTHETSNGVEYVNGSNCGTAGDLLCDTPADPNLFSCSNSSCQYTCPTLTDPLGQFYSPLMDNIMSYAYKAPTWSWHRFYK